MGSPFKIGRTDACISCGKCERACPPNGAKRNDLKGGCYLCHRCLDVCSTEGPLEYRRAEEAEGREGTKLCRLDWERHHHLFCYGN